MKILVTGGQGYKGSVLVPMLLDAGHEVVSLDAGWFGDNLISNERLQKVRGDVRNTLEIPLGGVDCVIHLASIANDPCGDLNPKLTWEVSGLATMRLADKAARCGVKQFIYASSGSVYGVNDTPEITEDVILDPISEYNKTKMVAERVVLSYQDTMSIQIVRPATVCGYSPRTRLDVAVNLLTNHAMSGKAIRVLGGEQTRPNIHIQDICRVYMHLLDRPFITGVFNAGFENLKIIDIAKMISAKTGANIDILPSNDPRSYRVNSDKLLSTGFRPLYTVSDAVDDLIVKFQNGELVDETRCHNLNWMIEKEYAGA